MKTFDINNPQKHNPFSVPEGYFDNLTARIMEQIPETDVTATPTAELKPKNNRRWIGWTLGVAASIALAVFFVNLPNLFPSANGNQQTAQVETSDNYDEQYEQEMLEYAMVDNSDIYRYLAGGY